MGFTEEDIDDIFSQHELNDDQQKRISQIRESYRQSAQWTLKNVKAGPEQTLAIRHLQEGCMMAISSIAREK